METGWEALDLEPAGEGRFRGHIGEVWQLATVPQGGIVAAMAVEAMEQVLADPSQTLRTMTSMFAGQVAGGAVEIDVRFLRRGRSMSQLMATVHNPGSAAGTTVVAAFGGPRRGVDFTEVRPPSVEGPEGVRSFRDPPPEDVDFEFARGPMPFWDHVVESRPVMGRAPWEPVLSTTPAECAFWYRLDHPPRRADGSVHVASPLVLSDTMPSSVGQKLSPEDGMWFGPSVDYTLHLAGPAPEGWLLTHHRARFAGDGYASVELALWDMHDATGPRLVSHGCQVMFFVWDR